MHHLVRLILISLFLCTSFVNAQDEHNHSATEKVGEVSFPTSCRAEVQQKFDRGVALLHSFAYSAAESAFRGVAELDSQCAMTHWGIAMTYYHQLWDPPFSSATILKGRREIQLALTEGTSSQREREYINALSLIYQDADKISYRTRALNYERAMKILAERNPKDTEAQVLYALALLANASPTDKTHANQKEASDILEPLFRTYPQHPGIPHYLIHAYDNAELAPRGLVAARDYSKIAPSAPHALHMPSHIFTRLGLWEDSIVSNVAAKGAAHRYGDVGEELHAMDYLVYAYLQSGRDSDAAQVLQQLKEMSVLNNADSKISYASTAMPVRYAVERSQWSDAVKIATPDGAPLHVAAIAIWARGLGLSRSGHSGNARTEAARLRQIELQLRASGNDYWATQVGIMAREIMAWSSQADGRSVEAVATMREAADAEDAAEKLPITPGPIIPAREQLGYLFLEQNEPNSASKEFARAIANAPGRRGALQGAARAAELSSHQ